MFVYCAIDVPCALRLYVVSLYVPCMLVMSLHRDTRIGIGFIYRARALYVLRACLAQPFTVFILQVFVVIP